MSDNDDSAQGAEIIKLSIVDADGAPPADDTTAEDGSRKGKPRGPREGLGKDCPVTPLGILGDVCFYLDANRQLRALKARDHSRLGILNLFGARGDYLYDTWPRMDKKGNVTGWHPQYVEEALMAAAAREGVWNALEQVRGVGAWEGENGELVFHCGDTILVGEEKHKPGKIGRYVYPAVPARPRPWPGRVITGEAGPASELLSLIRTWNWRRGEMDARLALGWICAAMIGGALAWRPAIWITGGRGTGKSTFHRMLSAVFDKALVSVSDASAAGVWQELGQATLPVAVDELEAQKDNRRGNAVIRLARQAASGGLVLRGGQDHHGAKFIARSCFLFSSILMPPLLPQDRSRMAILELVPPSGAPPPKLDPAALRELGAKVRRRVADGWERLPGVLEDCRAALEAEGHTARGADTFGTLLACADIALNDAEGPAGYAQEWALELRATDIAETADEENDEDLAVQHLLTSIWRHNNHEAQVGTWLRRACGEDPDYSAEAAERVCAAAGLRIVEDAGERWVAVATNHQGLASIFAGTHWAARSGAPGGWHQAMRRLPGVRPSGKAVYYFGPRAKATYVPLRVMLSEIRPEDQLVAHGGVK